VNQLTVDKPLFLVAHSVAKVRRQGVAVNGGPLQILRRGGSMMFGPFEPGDVVTYSGGFAVRFEILDVEP
jgi:hypothetical protein